MPSSTPRWQERSTRSTRPRPSRFDMRSAGWGSISVREGSAMPVEMIGWIAPRVASELIPPTGPPFDAEVIAETARIHERAGFDRVLIGYFSDAADGFLVGAHAASVTERLGFLLAHRPGFVAPPLAARKLATLDQMTGGRPAGHILSGGSDAD